MTSPIAFFGIQPYEQAAFEQANAQFGFTIQYETQSLTKETASLAKGCSAVCIFVNDAVDQQLVDLLYSMGVRLIALRCIGYDKIDLAAAKQKIKVVHVPEYSPYSVAEYAVGMILCLNRKYHQAYARTTRNNFNIDGLRGFDLHGKTVGVIGVGRIGAVAARILKGFGMRVLAYDIDAAQVKKAGAELVDLPTLYKESDIITLHAPLTKENKHMINTQSIDQMKKGVLVVNTGRGPLINTKDLLAGLESGKVGGAALDVYENEKEIFYKDLSQVGFDDPLLTKLLKLPQVLITSHQAFFTCEALHNIALTTLENIQEFFDGKTLSHEVHALE